MGFCFGFIDSFDLNITQIDRYLISCPWPGLPWINQLVFFFILFINVYTFFFFFIYLVFVVSLLLQCDLVAFLCCYTLC